MKDLIIRRTNRIFPFLIILATAMTSLTCGLFPFQGIFGLTRQVQVDADQGWQDTGISIAQGNQITIEYVSGLWFEDPPGQWHDASGGPHPWTCTPSACHEPLHNFPKYALIGRVGDGDEVLRIGDRLDFVSKTSGTLFLRPNYAEQDMAVFNPQGAVKVKIIVH